MSKKDNGRVIPVKNYFCLVFIILLSLMVIYYGYKWHSSYKDSLLSVSVLDNHLDVIKFNEVDDYITENKDALVYVSVLGNENIHEFEMDFVNTIKEYNLRQYLLYMDVSMYEQDIVNRRFDNSYSYPYIVVYTGGEITDIYDIKLGKKSSAKIVKYLNRIGVMEDD